MENPIEQGTMASEPALAVDSPYTMEELNARIDEAEQEMDSGGGKTFDEMMAGFKKELLWLKIN